MIFLFYYSVYAGTEQAHSEVKQVKFCTYIWISKYLAHNMPPCGFNIQHQPEQ